MRVVGGLLRKEHLIPRQYQPHLRRDMVNRMLAGESFLSMVHETFMPEQTLHRAKHEAPVDQGLVDGVNSTESAQLREAKKRIKARRIISAVAGRSKKPEIHKVGLRFAFYWSAEHEAITLKIPQSSSLTPRGPLGLGIPGRPYRPSESRNIQRGK